MEPRYTAQKRESRRIPCTKHPAPGPWRQVRALRFIEVDAGGNDVATGAWQAFSFTLQALDVSASDVHLPYDTGPVTNDRVTYDPRVSLALSGRAIAPNVATAQQLKAPDRVLAGG